MLTLRDLTHAVRDARIEHKIPICSSPQGYYLATTHEDLQAAKEDLRNRGLKILEAAAALGKTEPLPIAEWDQKELFRETREYVVH